MDDEKVRLIFQSITDESNRPIEITKINFHSQSLFPIYKAISSKDKEYAIKEIDSKNMADSEKEALDYFYNKGCSVPKCYGSFESEGSHFLIMDFINDTGKVTRPKSLVKTLLNLYQNKGEKWGWVSDNYIGTLYQKNQLYNSFLDFWWSGRIEPLVQQARDKGYIDTGRANRIQEIVESYAKMWGLEKIGPRLIHGDLWTGNVIQDKSGIVYLIDPSISYGHPEQDIGMAKMFGGFPKEAWIKIIQKELGLEDKIEERIPYWQIYPVLVHILLFGGSYVGSLNSIILRYS